VGAAGEVIPLVVAAKNEERSLGPCLDSLAEASALAEARCGVRFDPVVVLDDCSDGTEAVARARGVRTLVSSGGKVEAQRRGLVAGAPYHVFSDADIVVARETLAALVRVMRDCPEVEVACPPRVPLPPERGDVLARALHVYNRHRGFSAQRTWFSGKLFAIRRWHVPTREALGPRLAGWRHDRFYQWHRGMRVDDVYLSRMVLLGHGPGAIREVGEGAVYFRAPETLRGMYRYYRRMRMELERMDRLFPETRGVHERFGTRRTDPERLGRATPEERRLFGVFRAAMVGCRAVYALERAWYLYAARSPCADWEPIAETKRPIR
jgi:glycosyltransferase involved in cell wall biosynthesis